VDTQQSPRRVPDAVVEDVPGVLAAVGVGDDQPARPGGVQARKRHREGRRLLRPHQAISRHEALSPEPIPMSSTRSPSTSESCSRASVKGTEAGPRLPRVGKVVGTSAGSTANRSQIAWVCTLETWWMT